LGAGLTLTVPPAVGLALTLSEKQDASKLAVTDESAAMVKLAGLAALFRLPLQDEKA